MAYEVESERVGRFKVSIEYDDFHQISDAVNDEPVMIFERDRGSNSELLDQSKNSFPGHDVLRAINEVDSEPLLNQICDCLYSDWQYVNGKVMAEHSDWNRKRYFKTLESACAAMFFTEYGRDMSDLKVEQFGAGNRSETYFLCFWQSELDKYAGNKNAVSCVESCQAIVDGEVYGFRISGPWIDTDDGEKEGEDFEEHLDSCWGFIGDSSYCMSEGKACAEYMEKEAAEKDACAMAESIAESRPDLAPHY